MSAVNDDGCVAWREVVGEKGKPGGVESSVLEFA